MDSKILDWLANAPFAELVSTIERGLKMRQDLPTDGINTYIYGVGIAANEHDEDGWQYSMAGVASPDQYPGEVMHGDPWCQYGQCEKCGLEVVGATKKVRCPACDSEAYLT